MPRFASTVMSGSSSASARGEAGARDEEVVDGPAALAPEHLEAEHVDAVLREVPRDRGQAARTVGQAEADRAGRREAPGWGAG